jgi:RNA polymerase sigma-70 factor (ECF subfamily)
MSSSETIDDFIRFICQNPGNFSKEADTSYNLILRCQKGLAPDSAAFAELLRRYQSHVDRILYHLAPDWQDRADLAQEVWIRVYRNIKRLNEPVKFRGWLSRIATNLFYDELRKRKPVSDTLETREFYECLQLAISDLPEAFRTTIVLREIEGKSYEEIAEMTGVSLGTVKSRIARARAKLKLKSVLQNYVEGDPVLKTENADNVKQRILQQAFDLFEDEAETQRWLSTPKDGLDGQTPLEALATDAGSKKVEELLYRAEYGIFG